MKKAEENSCRFHERSINSEMQDRAKKACRREGRSTKWTKKENVLRWKRGDTTHVVEAPIREGNQIERTFFIAQKGGSPRAVDGGEASADSRGSARRSGIRKAQREKNSPSKRTERPGALVGTGEKKRYRRGRARTSKTKKIPTPGRSPKLGEVFAREPPVHARRLCDMGDSSTDIPSRNSSDRSTDGGSIYVSYLRRGGLPYEDRGRTCRSQELPSSPRRKS